DPDLAKSSVIIAGDERAAAVALAGVLPALFEAGADVPLVDFPVGVGLLTGLALHQRNLNLHHPISELSSSSSPHRLIPQYIDRLSSNNSQRAHRTPPGHNADAVRRLKLGFR